ncbi:hypothetical protein L7F22_014983 [Adiantum nelumboides]|nr:hypothetical protein [Adiantum nelumboides]
MTALDAEHDRYGFAVHKGYSTPDHEAALRAHGPCPEHRFSFANVAAVAGREAPAGLVHNGALPEQEPDPGDPEDTPQLAVHARRDRHRRGRPAATAGVLRGQDPFRAPLRRARRGGDPPQDPPDPVAGEGVHGRPPRELGGDQVRRRGGPDPARPAGHAHPLPGGVLMRPPARIWSVALHGVDGVPVEIEAVIGGGMPGVHLVGLPDAALNESKDRPVRPRPGPGCPRRRGRGAARPAARHRAARRARPRRQAATGARRAALSARRARRRDGPRRRAPCRARRGRAGRRDRGVRCRQPRRRPGLGIGQPAAAPARRRAGGGPGRRGTRAGRRARPARRPARPGDRRRRRTPPADGRPTRHRQDDAGPARGGAAARARSRRGAAARRDPLGGRPARRQRGAQYVRALRGAAPLGVDRGAARRGQRRRPARCGVAGPSRGALPRRVPALAGLGPRRAAHPAGGGRGPAVPRRRHRALPGPVPARPRGEPVPVRTADRSRLHLPPRRPPPLHVPAVRPAARPGRPAGGDGAGDRAAGDRAAGRGHRDRPPPGARRPGRRRRALVGARVAVQRRGARPRPADPIPAARPGDRTAGGPAAGRGPQRPRRGPRAAGRVDAQRPRRGRTARPRPGRRGAVLPRAGAA